MSTPSEYLTKLFSLEGRTVLITGGTRGIGAGLTLALTSAGADIILIQRDLSTGSEIKSKVTALGRKVTSYHTDLLQKSDVRAVVATILADGHVPDILINCGGLQKRAPAAEFTDDDWDDVLQVNLTASFALARDLAKYWIANPVEHHRKIVNISSVLALLGSRQVPAYVATKGGVTQLTKALSNEWATHKINVNAIAPGYIKTDLTAALQGTSREVEIRDRTPAGRWGEVDDLAGAVVYLASQASNYCSGETHVVDGGYTWFN